MIGNRWFQGDVPKYVIGDRQSGAGHEGTDASRAADSDWDRVLQWYPTLSSCPGWSHLKPWEWVALLSGRPEFVHHCNLSDIRGLACAYLLSDNPQFIDGCDVQSMDCYDWSYVLSYCPWLAHQCCHDFSTFRMWEMRHMIRHAQILTWVNL